MKIIGYESLGNQRVYDLSVNKNHNFILANGLIAHNCFVKAHSVAYSTTSYYTAYLKTHYPVEFMAAALTCDAGNQDQMIVYIQECKRMGIPVLPPDVNESDENFSVVNNTIRFGLGAIKNVGAAANHIIQKRQELGVFTDLFDFCSRVDLGIVNRKKLDSLVLAGCFDFTHQNRATLIQAIDLILAHKDDLKRYSSKLETYQKKLLECEQRDLDIQQGKLSDKGKALKPLKQPEKPEIPKKPVYFQQEEFLLQDRLQTEKELINFFISGHPLDGLKERDITPISYLKETDSTRPEQASLLSIVSNIELKETKTKQRMAFLKLEDLSGTIDAVIFPKMYSKYRDLIIKNIPLIVNCKVEYEDIESEDSSTGYITIPSLQILSIKTVSGFNINIQQDIKLEIPLNTDNILLLNKLLTKYSGKETDIKKQINIHLTTSSNTELVIHKQISDIRSFKTDLFRNIGS